MRSEKGIALVTALGLLLVMSVLVLGTFWTTQIELWTTRNDITSAQASYVAEAGLQKYKAALFNQYIWQEKNLTGGSPTGSVACYSSFANGIDWNRNGRIEQGERFKGGEMVLAQNEPVLDANGNPVGHAKVELYQINPRTYTLVSEGTSKGAKARVQAAFFLETVSPLNMAAFVKDVLRGERGASIRGGLYVQGDLRARAGVAFNENFSLLNRYDLNQKWQPYGPLAQAVSPAGVRADDLCATLRVFGKVYAERGIRIGEPANKLKGVYVGEQHLGGIRPPAIYTEDLGPFDLSDPPPFPTLDESGVCGKNLSWRICLMEEARLLLPPPPPGWPPPWKPGPPTPPPRVPFQSIPRLPPWLPDPYHPSCRKAFSDAQKKNKTLILGDQEVDCSYTNQWTKEGFKYTPGIPGRPATLEVYGTVVLVGYDVVLKKGVRYRAETNGAKNASFVVLKTPSGGGNLRVEGSLLPDTTLGAFPEHVLGLVAEENVYQKGPYMAAVVYAGNFWMNWKSVLVGSVVAHQLHMYPGSEVIFVNTAGNAPRALKMIDEYAKRFAFHTLSYERR